MQKSIKLILFSTPKEIGELTKTSDGITSKISPPTMAFDCGIDIDRAYEVFLHVSDGVAISLVANYIYDKIKKNTDNKAVIGGTSITGNNITITQIINVIVSEEKSDNGG
jgi:hypothetical protein